jgi:YVTN family beta-propeller protein
VSVINPANNTVIATITVGSGPAGVAVSPTGPEAGDVFVTNDQGGTVSVINPANNTVIANLTVGAGPFGAAVSPTTGDVVVTNETSSNVSVLG